MNSKGHTMNKHNETSHWIETWDAGYREFWRVVQLPDGTLLPVEGPYRRSHP